MSKRLFIFTVLILCLLSNLVFAQGSGSRLIGKESELTTTWQKQSQVMLPTSQALEKTIEPDKYVLGPGDVLAVSIWGEPNTNFNLTVTPEGRLLIPTVSVLQVSGMTLSDAKKKIVKEIKKKYISGEVTVTLLSLRKFRVTVAGAVVRPGTVVVTAMDRVSDAIEKAGGFLEKVAVTKQQEQTFLTTPTRKEMTVKTSEVKTSAELITKEASKRNISLTRNSGQTFNVDILMYQITGKTEHNPYLLDGDIIYVPVKEEDVGIVGVYGAVKMPGEYEYVKGDRLADIIALAHGLTIDADVTQATIVRFEADNKTTRSIKIDLKGLFEDESRNIPLKADDRIYIRYLPQFHRKMQVTVKGEVLYPGKYNIEEGKTRLKDIIQQAGGFTKKASLSNAEVIRKAHEELVDPEFERLKKMDIADMTQQEREYFKIKSREKRGAMAVDFEKLFVENDEAHNILLRDRDVINVPPVGKTVTVTGQVLYPGLVAYKPGQNLDYYIKEAGGYNWNARKNKIRIIKAKTKEWIKPGRKTKIEVGDTIFVPEKPERDWWGLFKDIMRVTSEIATVALIVQNAFRK